MLSKNQRFLLVRKDTQGGEKNFHKIIKPLKILMLKEFQSSIGDQMHHPLIDSIEGVSK